jgi:hypothetical protein
MLVPFHLTKEQVRITGPACNPIFDTPCPPGAIEQKREELGIDSDTRVILISNGVNGTSATPPFLNFLKKDTKMQKRGLSPSMLLSCVGGIIQQQQAELQDKFSPFFPLPPLAQSRQKK